MKKSKGSSFSAAPSQKRSSTLSPYGSRATASPRVGVAIMAAGKGTRLKSQLPKVLHEVGGKPLLEHVIRAAVRIVPAKDVYAIIGYEADRVRAAMEHTGVNFVLQAEQRGTGHALIMAREALAGYDHVIVLSGDAPLITPETIGRLRNFHLEEQAAMTLLSADLANPAGYGRVLRKTTRGAAVRAIVEEKAASSTQKKIREINSGFYVFAVEELYGNIGKLSTANAHGEYYLTDMAEVLRKARQRVVTFKTADASEVLGGNTRAELADNDEKMRLAKCRQLMADGVTVFFPATCVIDADVAIAPDTVIEPYVQLLGKTRIGSACRIRSYCVIRDVEMEDGVMVLPGCVMEQARIGAGAVVGPYSRLRPGPVIGDGVFIGSDSTLVAPVRVGKGAYVGASSCITEDVPADSLAIARSRQFVKAGWAAEKRAARKK